MYYYKHNNKILISSKENLNYKRVTEQEAAESDDIVYILKDLPLERSRRQYAVTDLQLIGAVEESPELLIKSSDIGRDTPSWLIKKIDSRMVSSININYPGWEDALCNTPPDRWRINIAGLGDVGGMLLTGLRLVGGDKISEIGIFDLDSSKTDRWFYEASQILSFGNKTTYPKIFKASAEELFNCDMFVFTVSAGVPPVGKESQDVRMVQYEANSKIINYYGRMAREAGFKGVFAVVSDPVDRLCKSVLQASNSDDSGTVDFKGLAPDQIRGYGLGVMYARAAFYAAQSADTEHFGNEGRAYGPHGEELVIADSIRRYNNGLSRKLTKLAVEANLEVRKTGFKPYIAPALSSGCLSIMSTIMGEYHYSSVFLGGVFMGCLNRMLPTGIEIERNDLPEALYSRILNSYERLALE